MIELVEQDALLRLRLLALAHVDQHVDCADNVAVRITQRGRIGDERNAGAVRTFGDRLGISIRGLP